MPFCAVNCVGFVNQLLLAQISLLISLCSHVTKPYSRKETKSMKEKNELKDGGNM